MARQWGLPGRGNSGAGAAWFPADPGGGISSWRSGVKSPVVVELWRYPERLEYGFLQVLFAYLIRKGAKALRRSALPVTAVDHPKETEPFGR